MLSIPISVRLDDDVRDELEAQARLRGMDLAAFLKELATEAARNARRERIRNESERVGQYVAGSSEAQAFYTDWGTPLGDAENWSRRPA